ncbi:zinc finger CCCH domain-containing protein 65-like isoform X2 [Typha angustifolia]|uniref:zinc finger CCCH domain-containing protein 65-like isoform X2 n=1 Tax=Typha angustifolia TaxID=59011 RepID=UPI003C2AC26C
MGVCEAKAVPKSEDVASNSNCNSTDDALSEQFNNLKLSEELVANSSESGGVALESQKLEDNGSVEKDTESARKGKEGKEEKSGKIRYPQRPEEQDCTFYVKTGSCKFGMNCRFNHPQKKKIRVRSKKSAEPSQAFEEKKGKILPESVVETEHKKVDEKGQEDLLKSAGWTEDEADEEKEELMEQKESKVSDEKAKESLAERGGQKECKFYFMSGGCKYGSSCKYVHHQGKSDVDSVELNFLGLPIRPGKRECPYYMRNGNCKFSTNCMYHHPDPTAVAERDSRNQNGETRQQNASVPMTSWSEQRSLNGPYPYIDASQPYIPGMILPPQGLHPNHDWNGYQVPVFAPDIQIHNYSASAVHHAPHKADTSVHQVASINEYPERPGLPECQYFMKNGSCKFKSGCKYHHPKPQLPSAASVGVLSPLGLPLKPDQPVCPHYSRYGICKFGPACKFDHPMNRSIPDSNTK